MKKLMGEASKRQAIEKAEHLNSECSSAYREAARRGWERTRTLAHKLQLIRRGLALLQCAPGMMVSW